MIMFEKAVKLSNSIHCNREIGCLGHRFALAVFDVLVQITFYAQIYFLMQRFHNAAYLSKRMTKPKHL